MTESQELLRNLHKGHQRIVHSRARASNPVWWPGSTKDIET